MSQPQRTLQSIGFFIPQIMPTIEQLHKQIDEIISQYDDFMSDKISFIHECQLMTLTAQVGVVLNNMQ